MREIKFEGKTAYITEFERRKLLERFDIKNCESEKRWGFYVIKIPCILCKQHLEMDCGSCPLNIARRNYSHFDVKEKVRFYPGCMILINSLIKKPSALVFSSGDIHWYSLGSKKILRNNKRALKKIHNALLALPRVARRKK